MKAAKKPVKLQRFVKLRYSLFDDEGSESTSSIDGRSVDHIIKMVREEAQEWADDQGASVSYAISDYDGNEVDEDTMEPAVAGRAPSAKPQRETVTGKVSVSEQLKRIKQTMREVK